MSDIPRRVDGGELVVEDDQHGWGGHAPSDGAAVEVLPGWGGGGLIYSTKNGYAPNQTATSGPT